MRWINDLFGYDTGDTGDIGDIVLKGVADRLRGLVDPARDVLGRLAR